MKTMSKVESGALVIGSLAALVAFASGCVASTEAADSSASALSRYPSLSSNYVGTNVAMAADPGAQETVDLAIDPSNGSHMLASAMSWEWPAKVLRHYESTNGGASWSSTVETWPGTSTAVLEQPRVAFDRQGWAHRCFVASSSGGTSSLTCRHKAPGVAWSPLAQVWTGVSGMNATVAVDRSGGAHDGRVHAVVTDITVVSGAPYWYVREVHSDDHGATWTPSSSAPHLNSNVTRGVAPEAAIGPNGEISVVWTDVGGPTSRLFLSRSTDGGVTWSVQLLHTFAIGEYWNLGSLSSPVDITVRASIDVDRSSGPHRGTIYVSYFDETLQRGLDAFVVASADGGLTWSTPRVVDDTSPSSFDDQYLPRLAVDDADGSVNVAWYDARRSDSLPARDVYYARSTDGGATFGANARVSSAPSGIDHPGQYIGLAARGGSARAAWADARDGVVGYSDVYTASITHTLVAAPTF